jgi:hypothetical protein
MPSDEFIREYGLRVLNGLLAGSSTLPELRSSIASYPEDRTREGRVIEDMLRFTDAFTDFGSLSAEVRKRVEERGGEQAMAKWRERMEFDEFLSGWDDSARRTLPKET